MHNLHTFVPYSLFSNLLLCVQEDIVMLKKIGASSLFYFVHKYIPHSLYSELLFSVFRKIRFYPSHSRVALHFFHADNAAC